jgi:hypothetical protein
MRFKSDLKKANPKQFGIGLFSRFQALFPDHNRKTHKADTKSI